MSMMSDIAGLSVSMHAAQLQQSVSISIAKKSMDSAELDASRPAGRGRAYQYLCIMPMGRYGAVPPLIFS